VYICLHNIYIDIWTLLTKIVKTDIDFTLFTKQYYVTYLGKEFALKSTWWGQSIRPDVIYGTLSGTDAVAQLGPRPPHC
jgi:hypothetical protein